MKSAIHICAQAACLGKLFVAAFSGRAEEKEYEEESLYDYAMRKHRSETHRSASKRARRLGFAPLPEPKPFEPRIDATCIVDGCSGKSSVARAVWLAQFVMAHFCGSDVRGSIMVTPFFVAAARVLVL
jgi:hypothetical protein